MKYLVFLGAAILSCQLMAATQRYRIEVAKVFPQGFHGMILTHRHLNPPAKIGEQIIIPFSKEKFCRATIEKVEADAILAKSISCPHHLLKVGQRALMRRPIAAKAKIEAKHDKKLQQVAHYSVGPIYIIATDLGSSSVQAEIPDRSLVVKNSYYLATSTMGMTCKLKVISFEASMATLDASQCPFERELQIDQELQAWKP